MGDSRICECVANRTVKRPIWLTQSSDLICEDCLDKAMADSWNECAMVTSPIVSDEYAKLLEFEGFVIRRMKAP